MAAMLKPYEDSDFEEVTSMMRRAFNEDAMIHRGIECGPEGYDDGSFVKKYVNFPGTESFTLMEDGDIIGLTILWINHENNENTLGCIYTDPRYHSKGIGAQIWHLIEERYPETVIWRTETPLCSTRNLNFYINKCGFMAYRIDDPTDRNEAIVQFVKYMKK